MMARGKGGRGWEERDEVGMERGTPAIVATIKIKKKVIVFCILL